MVRILAVTSAVPDSLIKVVMKRQQQLHLFFGWDKDKECLCGDEWKKQKLSSDWAQEAAAEAEAVALISCSEHGRAYLDGVVVDGKPVCECNTCYRGHDCSLLNPDCAANADG
ncbi:Alliin lyase 1 [Sesamum angolense]|uniref:Alliin lyase 1 n=1 Tax=Sesamum angolense TaxID=2727404 RepID=A0AAE1T6W6_9LAMI|nr:Alliin lyase 1 [Sesamum angolense]